MLDIGRQELSLQAKRRDLIAKVVEGRAVVATLVERHAAMARKIEEATAGLERLEEQLAALNTVIKVFDEEGFIPTAEPAPAAAPIPLRAVPSEPDAQAAPFEPARRHTLVRNRDSFKLVAFLRCVSEGHQMVNSRTYTGHLTCTRCRIRRRA
ncbi:MAG TPA: hypothetical protein VD906_09440 [Caulobacteraceae bacterium]|nr:hypothetical protein [Caulobacteraceae bacterium]